jgi:hypothetical protein
LFALTVLIEEISRRNPGLGINMHDISANRFGTKVSIETNKDQNLHEVGFLIQNAIDQAAQGTPFDVFAPQLAGILPQSVGVILEKVQKSQPAPVFVNLVLNQPVLQYVKADNSTLSGLIQAASNFVVSNYETNKLEVERLVAEFKDSFSRYESSMSNNLAVMTDQFIEAIRKGQEVSAIQNYWEQIKEGIKTGGAVTTLATNLAPSIARILGLTA